MHLSTYLLKENIEGKAVLTLLSVMTRVSDISLSSFCQQDKQQTQLDNTR